MKKPKMSLNFGEGGFQGWLVRHCEKMVLAVVALLALYVIWGGWSLPSLGSGKSPDQLMKTATEKRSMISKTSWEAFKTGREKQHNVSELIKDRLLDTIDPVAFTPGGRVPHLDPPDFPKNLPRKDPVLLAPVDLKIVPVVGALAYTAPMNGFKDPLDAAEEEEEKGKRRPARPARARGRAATDPMGIGMAAGGPMGAGGMIGGAMGMGEDPGMGMEDMGGMMGGMMGMGGGAGYGQFQAPSGSMLKTRYGAVVMALVPHQKQWEEFDKVFLDSLDPDQQRDRPSYRTFIIERVDVTEDPTAELTKEDWEREKISSFAASVFNEYEKWAGVPAEVLDPAYLEPVDYLTRGGLTHPLPPFVQRDLWDAMTHPKIPLASAIGSQEELPAEDAEPADEGGEEVPGGIPGAGGRRPGAAGMGMPGGMMGGGMMGAGRPGMPMAGGPGGRPGAPVGMPGGAGMPMGMGMGMGAGISNRPGMDGMGADPGRMMMGGMGMGMGMGGYSGPESKYKLVRFTDFTVEPGRTYRYRVAVLVNDPNHPPESFAAPPARALDSTVLDRLKGINPKETYRTSPFSQPSDLVTIPSLDRFLAGAVEPESSQEYVQGTRPVTQREAEATFLAVVHDPAKGVDVPVKETVTRGSTINLKTDVTVKHPIEGDPRELKEYEVQTDAVVADILGGQTLPVLDSKNRDEKLTVPGEVLIVDALGNLIVQNEAEDVEDFQRFDPPKEEKRRSAESEEDPGMNPMGGAFPGFQAPEGGRRPKR